MRRSHNTVRRIAALALASAAALPILSGCGTRYATTPTAPVTTSVNDPNASDAFKAQAAQQQLLAQRKQQEAMSHTAAPGAGQTQ